MTHFVADNLEYKIKIASPVSKRELSEFGASETTMESGKSPPESATAVVLQRPFLTSMPQVDANVLNDIEIEAQYLAANIDNITENLCNLLHSVSVFDKRANSNNIRGAMRSLICSNILSYLALQLDSPRQLEQLVIFIELKASLAIGFFLSCRYHRLRRTM